MNNYEDIKSIFDSLIKRFEFQILVKEYRQRFGIPDNGFKDLDSDIYKNWIKGSSQRSDFLKDQFLFLAKRCRNLIPNKDPILFTLLAYYFLFDKEPTLDSEYNEFIFSINPSGTLGNLDITFTVPILFNINKFIEETKKHKDEIVQVSNDSKIAIKNLSLPSTELNSFDPKKDLLSTTPGNGADIIDRVHRDIVYLAEFGRVILREHLQSMKDEDFIITCYEDKNKPIYSQVQSMGGFLLNRGLYPIAEEYWKNIDDEICLFNRLNKKRVNRGIPLANTGVSQIAQGKIIDGLFNIYRGYQDDKECLQHLSEILINPEKDMANSPLFTQFEDRLTNQLFDLIVSKLNNVFDPQLTKNQLIEFISSLQSDKKLLFYMVLYRFSFALSLNNKLTTVISRSEIIRSLSELALWFEDEMKRKDSTLRGKTLITILNQKVGQLNPTSGQFTNAIDLNELSVKISDSLVASGSLEITNARIMGCLRNFAGHNIDVQDHIIFQTCDEIFARMLSFIIYSKNQNWI